MKEPYGRFALYKIPLLEIAVVYFEIANGIFPKFAFVYIEVAMFKIYLQQNISFIISVCSQYRS